MMYNNVNKTYAILVSRPLHYALPYLLVADACPTKTSRLEKQLLYLHGRLAKKHHLFHYLLHVSRAKSKFITLQFMAMAYECPHVKK